MKWSLSLSTSLVLMTGVSTLAAQTRSAAELEVLGAVETFLEGLSTQDTTRMAGVIDSVTRLTLLRSSPAGTHVVSLSAADFMGLISRPNQPRLEESIRSPVVTIEGDLATVWAEYQVRIHGAVSHCGYDAFHLARLRGSWRIIHVSDTAHQDGCGETWPGNQIVR